MAAAPTVTPEVVQPASVAEAVTDFGDGDGVTILGGGTIVMVELTHHRLRPARVLMLDRAQMDGVRRAGSRTLIGAMTRIKELEDGAEPLAAAARGVGDGEIRGQATVGGNLCAPPGVASPRGDLQAALIALGARVRSAGAGGERDESVEDFLAGEPGRRLVLDVSFEEPLAAASASVRRPHSHAYTILAVHGARVGDELRLAATGAGRRAVRLRSVERALAEGADAQSASARALDDVDPPDDALASARYRRATLPVLVGRVLNDLR